MICLIGLGAKRAMNRMQLLTIPASSLPVQIVNNEVFRHSYLIADTQGELFDRIH
jgi:hypothetical protein